MHRTPQEWSSLFTGSQKPAFSFGIHTLLPICDVLDPNQAECECQRQQRLSTKLCPGDQKERRARPSQEWNLRTLEAFWRQWEEIYFSKLSTYIFNHYSCEFNKCIVNNCSLFLFGSQGSQTVDRRRENSKNEFKIQPYCPGQIPQHSR